MIGVNLVSIELSEIDAGLFQEYMRVKDTFDILAQAGVFQLQNSKAVLNFNGSGVLENIEVRHSAYKRGKSVFPQ